MTVLLLAVLVQPAAQGAVVGFDDFPGDDLREPFVTYTEDGFTLTPLIGDHGGDWLINRNEGSPMPSLENDTGYSEGETGAILFVTGGLFRSGGLDMLCGIGGSIDCEFFATGFLKGSTVFDFAAAGDDMQPGFVRIDLPHA